MSSNANTFFIVLPSNTKGNINDLGTYHEQLNRPNMFRINLPKKIQFDNGHWQCGLKSIVYPNSWPAIGTTETQFMEVVLTDGNVYRFQIPKGSYLTPQQLEVGLRTGIIKQLHNDFAEHSLPLEDTNFNYKEKENHFVTVDGIKVINKRGSGDVDGANINKKIKLVEESLQIQNKEERTKNILETDKNSLIGDRKDTIYAAINLKEVENSFEVKNISEVNKEIIFHNYPDLMERAKLNPESW